MHLSDVLTGHCFDYKAVVIAGQKAIAKATLGVAVKRGASRQRVLTKTSHKNFKNVISCSEFWIDFIHQKLLHVSRQCLTW